MEGTVKGKHPRSGSSAAGRGWLRVLGPLRGRRFPRWRSVLGGEARRIAGWMRRKKPHLALKALKKTEVVVFLEKWEDWEEELGWVHWGGQKQ